MTSTDTTTSTTTVASDGDSASMLAGVVTGDTSKAAGRPAPKPAPAKSARKPAAKSSTARKPAVKSGPRAAVKVGSSAPKPASKLADLLGSDYAGTLTDAKREVARAFVDAAGTIAQKWNPRRHGGIPVEFVAFALASWVNYAPVPDDKWSDHLAPRSGAGGRGAQNRVPAVKPAAKRATKPAATKPAGKVTSTTRKPAATKPAAQRAA